MERCKYYQQRRTILGIKSNMYSGESIRCVCLGTKEEDECHCGGDKNKCDFYLENIKKEQESMKAKLIINGKELEVEITEEELKKLEAKSAKKTGYERVKDGDTFWCDCGCGKLLPCCDFHEGSAKEMFDTANYYSDFDVAANNARADKLMRQLRRFAVEHREKELNWINEGQNKYTISFDCVNQTFDIDYWTRMSEFGTMYFDSQATAELAIDTFRDELLWYFTEYEDSL